MIAFKLFSNHPIKDIALNPAEENDDKQSITP